jgi:hypothetical protein
MFKRGIIGLALLAVAATAIIARQHWLAHIRSTPFEMVIPMSVGHSSTGNFKVDISYVYLIEIHFHQPNPVVDCLVGVETNIQRCDGYTSVLQVKWELYDDQTRIVKDGMVHGPGGYLSNDGGFRTLGSFDGQTGRAYRLQLENLKDASALARTNPTLVVHPHREVLYRLGGILLFCRAIGLNVRVGWRLLGRPFAVRAP